MCFVLENFRRRLYYFVFLETTSFVRIAARLAMAKTFDPTSIDLWACPCHLQSVSFGWWLMMAGADLY
jgi:hypothetical protein